MREAHTACPVEQSVPLFDGIVYNISAGVVVHLPQPQPHLRHLSTIVELDRWDLYIHHGGFLGV